MIERLHGDVTGPAHATRLSEELRSQLGGAPLAAADGAYGAAANKVAVVTVAGGRITGITERNMATGGGGGGGAGYFPTGW